jgi:hypothetical protein
MSSKDPVPLTPEPLTPKELADLRLLMGVNVTPPEEMDEASGLTLAEKSRLAAHGALFSTSDEAAAALRSVLGGVPYDEALADERAKLEAARDKPGSFKYELGGAIVPGLLAAPFTAGTSVPMTMGRLAFFGGSRRSPAPLAREREASASDLQKTLRCWPCKQVSALLLARQLARQSTSAGK